MSNDQPAKQAKPQQPDRTPIAIERLIIHHENTSGVKLPDGNEGKGMKPCHDLHAGEQGSIRIAIEHRPWLRVFHVTKERRVGDSWQPMGKPFRIPDSWAVSVPVGD